MACGGHLHLLWAYDPEEVTCRACLRSVGLREHQGKWPPVRVLSSSFTLLGKPESIKRSLTLITRALDPAEVDVLTTLLLERVPDLLEPPDETVVIAYRAARAAAEKRKANQGDNDG